MNELVRTGKKRTILISISILLISIHTIYFYQTLQPELATKKLIQQIIRFVLTVGLLIALYHGKSWARTVAIVLFGIAALGAIISIVTVPSAPVNKIPFFVMTFIYSLALYHFGFAKSFKAFYEYQNKGDKDTTYELPNS